MKERPILFKGPLVRAILDGRKTQTRRLVKGTARDWLEAAAFTPKYVALPENFLCPYGYAGDRLWVRETWGISTEDLSYRWTPGTMLYRDIKGPEDDCIRWRPSIHMPREACRLVLEITDVRAERVQDISEADALSEGVESIDSRAHEERDARDFDPSLCGNCGGLRLYTAFAGNGGAMPDTDCARCDTVAKRFRALWESTGADWDSNPYVWSITFKKVQP